MRIHTAAILINDVNQQYEGLRTSVGLQLNDIQVKMFVLHQEIVCFDETFTDSMIFFEEMGGERFSNNQTNVEEYGFKYAGLREIASMLRETDHIVPF